MATAFIAAFVNIIANYCGITIIGTCGAAVGTMIAYIVMSIVRILDVRRFINIRINWGRFLIVCILAIAHAIFVTLDIYSGLISVLVITLFIAMYYKMIMDMLSKIGSMMFKR